MNIAISAEVRWGVRFQIPGETEQVKPVGSPHLADELIRDLQLQHGVTGRLVRWYQTPPEEV